MIIDCHGHYTTEPAAQMEWRKAQLKLVENGDFRPTKALLEIGDDAIREGKGNQLKQQRERGTDKTIFRRELLVWAITSALSTQAWSGHAFPMTWCIVSLNCTRIISSVSARFLSTRALSPNTAFGAEQAVNELGFIGCNLNLIHPGQWLTRRLRINGGIHFTKKCELDVPAMIHVSGSCNPNFHPTGAHYIAADTTAFMQLISGDLFKDFPSLKFVIPHGGGAVPFHWGRYRGLAQDMGKPRLDDHLLDNVFFDTCVYHQAGIDCMTKVVPVKNILFASEMVGAVQV